MASSPLALAQVLSAKQSNSGTVEEAKGRLHPVNLGVNLNVSFACKTCHFEYFLSDKANFGIQTVTELWNLQLDRWVKSDSRCVMFLLEGMLEFGSYFPNLSPRIVLPSNPFVLATWVSTFCEIRSY